MFTQFLSISFLFPMTIKGKNQKESGPKYRFTFDFGPSWYWMPDLFDAIYERFGGRKVSEFYERKLLDPAYRIYHKNTTSTHSSSSKGNLLLLMIFFIYGNNDTRRLTFFRITCNFFQTYIPTSMYLEPNLDLLIGLKRKKELEQALGCF